MAGGPWPVGFRSEGLVIAGRPGKQASRLTRLAWHPRHALFWPDRYRFGQNAKLVWLPLVAGPGRITLATLSFTWLLAPSTEMLLQWRECTGRFDRGPHRREPHL